MDSKFKIILFSISYFQTQILKSFHYVPFSRIPMNIIVQRQSPRFLEQLFIHAIFEPILSARRKKVQRSFLLLPFSLSPHRFIPDPPIQFSLTFLVVFYTDIFYSSIPIFIHCSRSRTVPILNQTRSPINRRSCEFASRLKKERTTYILNDG